MKVNVGQAWMIDVNELSVQYPFNMSRNTSLLFDVFCLDKARTFLCQATDWGPDMEEGGQTNPDDCHQRVYYTLTRGLQA